MVKAEEILEATGSFLIGATLGYVILKFLESSQCPVCRNTVNKRDVYCPNCNVHLAWGANRGGL